MKKLKDALRDGWDELDNPPVPKKPTSMPPSFVGEVVVCAEGQGVVLDYVVERRGLSELLLVFNPNSDEPFVLESREVAKVKFVEASPRCQSISKALLFQAKSKEYLHR